MTRGTMFVAYLSVLLATACTEARDDVFLTDVDLTSQALTERLSLAPGSVQAFHAALLERSVTDLGRRGLRPNLHTYPSAAYRVGVRGHEEGTVPAALQAPRVPLREWREPGVFHVKLVPVLFDNEGNNIFPTRAAIQTYDDLQDGQGMWAHVSVSLPEDRSGPRFENEYLAVLTFDAREDRWELVAFRPFGDKVWAEGEPQQWLTEVLSESR